MNALLIQTTVDDIMGSSRLTCPNAINDRLLMGMRVRYLMGKVPDTLVRESSTDVIPDNLPSVRDYRGFNRAVKQAGMCLNEVARTLQFSLRCVFIFLPFVLLIFCIILVCILLFVMRLGFSKSSHLDKCRIGVQSGQSGGKSENVQCFFNEYPDLHKCRINLQDMLSSRKSVCDYRAKISELKMTCPGEELEQCEEDKQHFVELLEAFLKHVQREILFFCNEFHQYVKHKTKKFCQTLFQHNHERKFIDLLSQEHLKLIQNLLILLNKKEDFFLFTPKAENKSTAGVGLQDGSMEQQCASSETSTVVEERREKMARKTHLETETVNECDQGATSKWLTPEHQLSCDSQQKYTATDDPVAVACTMEKEQPESSMSKNDMNGGDKMAQCMDHATTPAFSNELTFEEHSCIAKSQSSLIFGNSSDKSKSSQVSISESKSTETTMLLNCHEDCISGTAYSSKEQEDSVASREILQWTYEELRECTGGFDARTVKQGGNQIGTGSYGEVFYGRMLSTSGDVQDVAVKRMKEAKTNKLSHVKLTRRQFAAESMAMTRCDHPNIVRLVGQCAEGPHLCLVYEFVSGGNLGSLIRKDNPNSPLGHVRLRILSDIACALEYLHTTCSPALVHRDIKTANILINADLRGKLADFGLCISVDDEDDPWTSFNVTSAVGTRSYMAPEAFLGKVSPKIDIYSFGVLLYELTTGLPSFSPVTKKDLVTYLRDLEREGCNSTAMVDPRAIWMSDVSSDLLKLSRWCTDYDSHNRPRITVVVSILAMLIRDHYPCSKDF